MKISVNPKRRRREIIEPRPQGLGSRANNYKAPEGATQEIVNVPINKSIYEMGSSCSCAKMLPRIAREQVGLARASS